MMPRLRESALGRQLKIIAVFCFRRGFVQNGWAETPFERFDHRDSGPSPEAFEPGKGSVSGHRVYEEGRHRLLRPDRACHASAFGRTRVDAQAVSRWRGGRTFLRE